MTVINVALETGTTVDAAGVRRCSTCKVWLRAARFSLDRSRPDGLSARCRGCDAARVREGQRRRRETAHAKSVSKQIAAGWELLEPTTPLCALCATRAGRFVLADGRRACAGCLKKRVKERRSP